MINDISVPARNFIRRQGGVVTLDYEIEACGCGPPRYFPTVRLGAPPLYQSEEYHLRECDGIVLYILKNMKWQSGILLDIDMQTENGEESLVFRLTAK